ncbi:MAG TPA: SDR family NAD(P)-dependent oxidoreductase [Puia sp.]|nr:SDR family NAD(P)-dependent oxidoreductase [Puia sp.]
MNNKIIHIVLLGGGNASIWAYRSLLKGLDYAILFGEVRITVVCPEDVHFFHGWTAESLGGIIQDQNRMSPLVDLFLHAQLIKGAASRIDHSANRVHITGADGSTSVLDYDHLLIGIGAFDSEKIDGLKEYGYQVKSHAAFLRTRREIQSLVEQAAISPAEEAKRHLQFTVAGSGLSGVELVCNIAEFVDVLKAGYPSLRDIDPVIRLVSSKANIIDELDRRFTRMRSYAERTMQRYGIELIRDQKIVRITRDGAQLSDGRRLESRMVVSAIGQCRMLLNGTEEMERDEINRLRTNANLQVPGHPNIWGGGDACNVPHIRTGRACPSNALWAIRQGEHAGKNIARAVKGRQLRPFTFRGLGQCASLGIGKGMGELFGLELTGWLAWALRWAIFQYFMPSKKVMFNEIMDWMHLLIWRRRKGLPAIEQHRGRTCWITGASGGIGAELARQLNHSGARLILSARNAAGLEAVRNSCTYPEKVTILPCDMEKPEALAEAADRAWKTYHGIDYVYLNAGMAIRDMVLNTGLDMIQKVMNVNFFGNTVVTKSLLPRMIERGSGTFVVTSSICGRFGVPKLSAYSASKHALHGFYESLRSENEGQGIKVTMITSGLVRTDITVNALKGDGRPYARMQEAVANGISPVSAAKAIIRAVVAEKREVLVGGIDKYGVLVKRFFPGLLAWAIARHPLRRLRNLKNIGKRTDPALSLQLR